MTAKMIGTCEACQQNKHHACANEGVCICSMRGHPHIEPLSPQANVYMPNPGAE